jgi:hypothetical protein
MWTSCKLILCRDGQDHIRNISSNSDWGGGLRPFLLGAKGQKKLLFSKMSRVSIGLLPCYTKLLSKRHPSANVQLRAPYSPNCCYTRSIDLPLSADSAPLQKSQFLCLSEIHFLVQNNAAREVQRDILPLTVPLHSKKKHTQTRVSAKFV